MVIEQFVTICALLVSFIILVLVMYSVNLAIGTFPIFIEAIFFTLILTVYVNKDAVNGQSFIKRKFGYQIVDVKSEEPANPVQCMVRNMFFFLLPLDIIILMLNPQRKTGDYFAASKLIKIDPATRSKNTFQMLFSFFISFCFFYFLFYTYLKTIEIIQVQHYVREVKPIKLTKNTSMSYECYNYLKKKAYMSNITNFNISVFEKSNDSVLQIIVSGQVNESLDHKVLDSLTLYFNNIFGENKYTGRLDYVYGSARKVNKIVFH
jgi:uncharacterized RDD family membrane protein YckC